MNKKIKFSEQVKSGLITNNPIFVQFLGMCPTLATTTSVTNAIGMGIAVIVVLTCSNLIISLLRKFIPKEVRIASYVVIIAGFVTAVELVLKAYFPDINASLGIFIPLIVVNCLLLARAEAFASKNPPIPSIIDGLTMGAGYMCALVLISFVRELLGTGAVFAGSDGTGGIALFGPNYSPATLFILPTGAFITLAFFVAGFQKILTTVQDKQKKAKVEAERAQALAKMIADETAKEENK